MGWPLVLCLAVSMIASGCDAGADRLPMVTTPTPAMFADGDTLFVQNCQICHGERASGSDQGPPLVHQIYEPSHHADISFLRAVQLGVVAHHWRFGNMPPIEGMTATQIGEIVGYIRWLQRESGIE